MNIGQLVTQARETIGVISDGLMQVSEALPHVSDLANRTRSHSGLAAQWQKFAKEARRAAQGLTRLADEIEGK